MDGQRFDDLVKRLAAGRSRRSVLLGVAGGMISGAASLAGPTRAGARQTNQITICHATGSATNPYIVIAVAEDAIPDHAAHGDLVGDESCPDNFELDVATCTCVCPLTDDACPNLEVVDETCACVCPGDSIACGEGEELDRDTCACVPIPSGCAEGFVCGEPAHLFICDDENRCLCTAVLEGGAQCVPNFSCGPHNIFCESSEECVAIFGEGAFCQAPATGCCGQICVPPGVCAVGGSSLAVPAGPTNAGSS